MELPPGCSPATSTGWGTRGETATAQGWVPRPCPLLTCPQAPHFGVTPGCWSTPSLDVPHFEGGWRDCATWGSCWRKWSVGGGGLCFTPHFHPISPPFSTPFLPHFTPCAPSCALCAPKATDPALRVGQHSPQPQCHHGSIPCPCPNPTGAKTIRHRAWRDHGGLGPAAMCTPPVGWDGTIPVLWGCSSPRSASGGAV